jgi:hypothetical protein
MGLGGAGVGLDRRAGARGTACTSEGHGVHGRGARRARATGAACRGRRGAWASAAWQRGARRRGGGAGVRRCGPAVACGLTERAGQRLGASASLSARGETGVARGLSGQRRGVARRRRACSDGSCLKRAIETSERRPRMTM